MALQIGDEVNVDLQRNSAGVRNFKSNCDCFIGNKPNSAFLRITNIPSVCGEFQYTCHDIEGNRIGSCCGHELEESDFIIYKINNKNTSINMSLQSKIKELLRKEPQKSLVKVGILDDNENFTPEGKDVFLQYLLEKNIDGFNTDVVQPLLVAQEIDKK